ncbi:hypothetical protein [Kitasatospora purpeofusca]
MTSRPGSWRPGRARDRHLHYLDGRELLGPADVDDLPDGLHPSAAA